MVNVPPHKTWRHRAWRRWAIIVSALVLGQVSWLLASSASACNPTTVCFYWDAAWDDSNVGEDYPNGPVKASGARVVVLRPPPETPLTSALDTEGCITFDTQYSYGHKALVYADAVIGGVRLLPALNNNTDVTNRAVPQTLFWEVHMQGLEPNGSAPAMVAPEIGLDQGDAHVRMLPIFAAATATMRRFEELGVMPPTLDEDETIYLAYRPVFGNARCWCDGTSPSVVDIGVDSFREKFVIAHELGHWLDATWNGAGIGVGAYNYLYDPVDAPCEFGINPAVDIDMNVINSDGQFHGIRSAEWSGGGLVEGIAHFIAAVTWNDPAEATGFFRYYKDIQLVGNPSPYQDFVDGGSLVALEGGVAAGTVGGRSRWVATQCPTDWAAWDATHEVTSEIDWMRFWWRFLSDQATEQPTLADIFEFTAFVEANDPWENTLVWTHLSDNVDAAGSPLVDFAQRFTDIADEEGVSP